MTISEIKRRTLETSPYFFSAETLKFFHQKLTDFRVTKQEDGRYLISAPMKDHSGRNVGNTVRYFDPITNKLEMK